MKRFETSARAGLLACALLACGPNKRPEQGCDGPSFNLLVRAEAGPLPADTHLLVRYGSNQEGELYRLGQTVTPQAVFCDEDTTPGGAASDAPAHGAGDGGASSGTGVESLRCRLYTQGPARLDAAATGYEPITDLSLSFDDEHRCEVNVDVQLRVERLDAGR